MDRHARNEYMNTLPRAIMLRQRYLHAAGRPEKSRILDEYCANTGQNRKYAIRKIRPGSRVGKKERKKRKTLCESAVIAALACVWQIFDYPCGQRLKPLLLCEVDRQRDFVDPSVPAPARFANGPTKRQINYFYVLARNAQIERPNEWP